MASNRRKAAVTPALVTVEEAAAAVAEYREAGELLKQFEADRDLVIGRAKALFDERAAPLKAKQKAAFDLLKPWWPVKGAELAGGRKSMELAGCTIGTRLGNPQLVMPDGKEADAARALLEAQLTHLARVTYAVNKPAVLAVVRATPTTPSAVSEQATVLALGFGVEQAETFFVEPATAAPGVELVTADDRRAA